MFIKEATSLSVSTTTFNGSNLSPLGFLSFRLELGLELVVGQAKLLRRSGPELDGLCDSCLHLVGLVHAAEAKLEDLESGWR